MKDNSLTLRPLDSTGIIRVTGRDARDFLHAQLTRDIEGLGADIAPLAGWCDARGRVLAIARVVAADDAYLLLVPRDSLEMLITKLSMYILRAEVRLREDEALEIAALIGPSANWRREQGFQTNGETNAVQWRQNTACVDLGGELAYLVGPGAELEALTSGLDTATESKAVLAEIALGLPTLTSATTGHYIPQMLNLDRLDAVSFDKGCYPGQEIVARAHHLGTVKRRMRRFQTDAAEPPPTAAALVDAGGDTVGEVVRSAATETGAEFLAVVRLEALSGPVYLAAHPDIPLRERSLPY